MRRRRTFRDASPFYDSLREGLPEAIHKTLFETRDIVDAARWLEDGTRPDGESEAPGPGARIAQPDRFVISAIGVDEQGRRWLDARRRRYETADQLRTGRWDNTFQGQACHGGSHMRGQLRTTGRGNTRKYHVWWTIGDDGRPQPETVQVFVYQRAAPLYEIEPEDPPREALALNEAQAEIVRVLTER